MVGLMDVHDLIASLIRDEDRVPRERIDECAQRGAAMIEALGAVIGPEADWSVCESNGHWWLRLHAAFILGLMDDAEAGRLLLHLMRRLADGQDENVEDWLAGYWPALFRNKPDAVVVEVEAFAWSHHAQPYMRGHAVEVLLAAAARRGSDALDACLARTAEWVSNAPGDADERAMVATVLLDFPRAAHRTLLESLAALQKVRFAVFGLPDVEAAYAGPDKPGWLRFDDPWKFYAPDQIEARQRRWVEEDQRRLQRESTGTDWGDDHVARESYVRDSPKVGRNEPCPCGSGKKYKKCCLGGAFLGAADS
jgi:hypothetical protein